VTKVYDRILKRTSPTQRTRKKKGVKQALLVENATRLCNALTQNAPCEMRLLELCKDLCGEDGTVCFNVCMYVCVHTMCVCAFLRVCVCLQANNLGSGRQKHLALRAVPATTRRWFGQKSWPVLLLSQTQMPYHPLSPRGLFVFILGFFLFDAVLYVFCSCLPLFLGGWNTSSLRTSF
jgi:hypothetical protein